MHEAFVSLMGTERRSKNFIYLENSILSTNTIFINCPMESTCLALATTVEPYTTAKDFIFGTLLWRQAKAFILVLLISIAISKSTTQILGFKKHPRYATILTHDFFWMLTTPFSSLYKLLPTQRTLGSPRSGAPPTISTVRQRDQTTYPRLPRYMEQEKKLSLSCISLVWDPKQRSIIPV